MSRKLDSAERQERNTEKKITGILYMYVNCKVGKGKALQYKRFSVNIILTIVQFTVLQTFTSKTIGTLPKPTKFPKIISK